MDLDVMNVTLSNINESLKNIEETLVKVIWIIEDEDQEYKT